jgi:hypothetical protein
VKQYHAKTIEFGLKQSVAAVAAEFYPPGFAFGGGDWTAGHLVVA